jgi:hypothetical protein
MIQNSIKFDAVYTTKTFNEVEAIDIANKAMILWYRKVMGV